MTSRIINNYPNSIVLFISFIVYFTQGRVKVVRTQTIIDVQNETKFVNQSTEELGCTRPYSHADGKMTFFKSCQISSIICEKIQVLCKIVSEYDQEIPLSQTAEKPMAPHGRAT